MRKKIIAGNWKMNTCLKKGQELAEKINLYAKSNTNIYAGIILGVPFTHLYKIVNTVDLTKISVAAQNCASEESGAYTGEVSAGMIKSTGANYIIIGHSERRQFFSETDEIIAKKINLCIKNELFPIFCCGESLQERNESKHFEVVEKQINTGIFHLDKFNIEQVIIAYEPVWAIGTGVNASPGQAQEMHEYIRKITSEKYSKAIADKIPVLYGGSVKPDNAGELFKQPDIDGGLIGGASLKADDFIEIIKVV